LTVPGKSAERYYRDKIITRRFLAEKAAEKSDLRCILFVNGRLTEWAPIKHFGIDTEKRSARIVGTKDMEQNLLGVEEYVVASILEAAVHYVEHHAEKNADKINCTAQATYLVSTLLVPQFASDPQELTYRFVENNYSWQNVFETLERVQVDRGPGENSPYSVVYASVAEAREKQQHAITMGNVDDELKYSHQFIQGTGRTLCRSRGIMRGSCMFS
jgi:hypothetical protein